MEPVVRSPTRTAALETRWITARTLGRSAGAMPGVQEESAVLAFDLESDVFDDEEVVFDLLSFLSEESLSFSDLPPDLPTLVSGVVGRVKAGALVMDRRDGDLPV